MAPARPGDCQENVKAPAISPFGLYRIRLIRYGCGVAGGRGWTPGPRYREGPIGPGL